MTTLSFITKPSFPAGIKGSILLLDKEGKHLVLGSAPSLEPSYNQAINGLEIGWEAGSCGSAAFRRELVIVEDIITVRDWVRLFLKK